MSTVGAMKDEIPDRRDLRDGEKLGFRSPGDELERGQAIPLPRRRTFQVLTQLQRMILLVLGFCAVLFTSLVLSQDCAQSHGTALIPSLTVHPHQTRDTLPRDDATSATGVLQVFQVNSPVLGSDGIIDGGSNASLAPGEVGAAASGGNGTCNITLMEFTFANSFGKPFVGELLALRSFDIGRRRPMRDGGLGRKERKKSVESRKHMLIRFAQGIIRLRLVWGIAILLS